jgi:5'-nucleotidase
MTEKPLILVTNDDGIRSPGIRALAEVAKAFGEVRVVAPETNRSGVAHCLSLLHPLRCTEHEPGWWGVDGTPSDCVYLAVHEILNRPPAMVLSGINAGPNLSYDVHYSGTVAAAYEAALLGLPAIALSSTDPKADFVDAARAVAGLIEMTLRNGLPKDVTLNVNIPPGRPTKYQMTFLGHRLFLHRVHRREDPRGSPYYWIGGVPDVPADVPGSDCDAVSRGWISITPLSLDFTHTTALREDMQELGFEGAESVPNPYSPRRFGASPYGRPSE